MQKKKDITSNPARRVIKKKLVWELPSFSLTGGDHGDIVEDSEESEYYSLQLFNDEYIVFGSEKNYTFLLRVSDLKDFIDEVIDEINGY